VAVRFPGTEEPDWAGGLGYFEGEDSDLSGGRVEGHERRRETVALCDSIELLSTRVGKGTLGDGVVATVELKVDKISDVCSDNLRIKDERSRACLVRSDNNRNVRSEGRDDTNESSEDGSSELHV